MSFQVKFVTTVIFSCYLLTDAVNVSTFSIKEECFQNGECLDSLLLQGDFVTDEFACLEFCKKQSECLWFTFYPGSSYCTSLIECQNLSNEFCTDCLSGKAGCVPPEPQCWIEGLCHGHLHHIEEGIASIQECVKLCQSTLGCKWVTYQVPKSTKPVCSLFEDCSYLDETCTTCISAERRCSDQPDTSTTSESTWSTTTTMMTTETTVIQPEAEWHMIIEEYKIAEEYRGMVHLFNWKTKEECRLSGTWIARYFPTAFVFEDTPVICGGANGYYDPGCEGYDKALNRWFQISPLLEYGSDGPGIVVPEKGVYIFRGGRDLSAVQHLKSLDSNWIIGPAFYEGESYFQCVIQLNETVTVFIGGSNHPDGIITLDWNTMEYREQPETLFRNDTRKTCALMKKPSANGYDNVVVIIEHWTQAIEIWNSQTGTIEEVPQAPNCPNAYLASLVPVNDGYDLLLYCCDQGSVKFLFHGSNYTWTRLEGDNDCYVLSSTIFAVPNISCP